MQGDPLSRSAGRGRLHPIWKQTWWASAIGTRRALQPGLKLSPGSGQGGEGELRLILNSETYGGRSTDSFPPAGGLVGVTL
jgi:hypothetical protein